MNPFIYSKIRARLYIKKTPFIYKHAKRLRDKKASDKLASADSDLCLEGYPSSANSFTYVLLQHLNEDLKIAHHCHSIANIKIALKLSIPTVVTIRNPEEAISSRIARFGSGLDESIYEYIDFYKYVLENLENLIVITFDTVTQKTANAITKIYQAAGVNLNYDDLEQVKESVVAYIEEWTEKHGNPRRISLPTEQREKRKAELRKVVTSHPNINQAKELFDTIINEIDRVNNSKDLNSVNNEP